MAVTNAISGTTAIGGMVSCTLGLPNLNELLAALVMCDDTANSVLALSCLEHRSSSLTVHSTPAPQPWSSAQVGKAHPIIGSEEQGFEAFEVQFPEDLLLQ
jgi:hypothetical protein